MKCPKCSSLEGRVIDSRLAKEAESIRRRRECLECGYRFTTYEVVEDQDIRVIKADGRYEPFDRNKLSGGIIKACEKRPVRREQIDAMIVSITGDLEKEFEREIPSRAIGEKIMEYLRGLDEVAYVRFASVYRRFKDLDEFEKEIRSLREISA